MRSASAISNEILTSLAEDIIAGYGLKRVPNRRRLVLRRSLDSERALELDVDCNNYDSEVRLSPALAYYDDKIILVAHADDQSISDKKKKLIPLLANNLARMAGEKSGERFTITQWSIKASPLGKIRTRFDDAYGFLSRNSATRSILFSALLDQEKLQRLEYFLDRQMRALVALAIYFKQDSKVINDIFVKYEREFAVRPNSDLYLGKLRSFRDAINREFPLST